VGSRRAPLNVSGWVRPHSCRPGGADATLVFAGDGSGSARRKLRGGARFHKHKTFHHSNFVLASTLASSFQFSPARALRRSAVPIYHSRSLEPPVTVAVRLASVVAVELVSVVCPL